MDRLKYWRLQSRFSVRQAAALQIGINPAEFGDLLERGDDDWIYDYEAIVAAFIDALKTSELEGDIHWVEQDYIPFSNYSPEPEDIDINKTMIPRENITSFLSARDFETGFFLEYGADGPSYLNPNHPHYAVKLAAAVRAWEAVTADESLLRNKTPKQAIEKWLRDNLDQFELPNGEKLTEAAIKEISKIANWMIRGGAPKTA